MEYILTDIRKGHMCNAKLLRNMPGKLPSEGSQDGLYVLAWLMLTSS